MVAAESASGEHTVGECHGDPAAVTRLIAGNVNIGQRQVAGIAADSAAEVAGSATIAHGHSAHRHIHDCRNVEDAKVRRRRVAPHGQQICSCAVHR